MSTILKAAQEKMEEAEREVARWKRFIDDYKALTSTPTLTSTYTEHQESTLDELSIRYSDFALRAAQQKSRNSSRNKIPEKYAHLTIAPMGKCIELTKSLIRQFGSIHSTSRLLELFAEEGYTVKPHTLAAYLSQTDDFVFDKARGGWNLAEARNELAV